MRHFAPTDQALAGGLASRGLAVLLLLTAAGCGDSAIPPGSNILLITIDTLRADHLSAYGYERQTSPTIDQLAEEGVRFDQAVVQWPKTGPSFASMFTSTYPKNNGIVRKVGIPVPDDFLMLAEMLQARGYGTYAVVSNGAVGKEFNFDQGFDVYLETWRAEDKVANDLWDRADEVNRLARQVAGQIDRRRPFFLWLHYLDPHFPYSPPGDWASRFQTDGLYDPEVEISVYEDRANAEMDGIGRLKILDGRTDLAFYLARYDAEVAYVDQQLGEMLEFLEREELLERTLTVLTSDHGESLGDHSYYFDHGRFGFETCLRVPLIFHYPGHLKPMVDPDPVELIGLTPTLLEMAGVKLEDGRWMQGSSLIGRLQGERLAAEEQVYAFSEAGYGRVYWQKIVRNRRFKLIQARSKPAQPWVTGSRDRELALFDLKVDPGETENIVDQHPKKAARLLRILTHWVETPFDAVAAADGEQEIEQLDDATRKQLEALGYLD